VQVILMILIVWAAAWTMRRTRFGREVLAVGGNQRAARLAGVPVDHTIRRVYIISGLCSGIAGLIVISINSSADANVVGLGSEFDAIAAVTVGGTRLSGGVASMTGTVIGALIIQIVRYMLLANGVPDSAAMVVKAGLIILAVALQTQGQRA
jgi:ribose transport system permease protein